MSKYRGPRLRIIRRLGRLPAFSKKRQKSLTRPGQHGASRIKFTQFAYRLAEKQKVRFYYGISEKQITRFIQIALNRKGRTGKVLVQKLEIRLDTVIYRSGWASTLLASRQRVNHGHILVNTKPITIPSFLCSPKDMISVRDKESSRSIVSRNLAESRLKLPQNLSINKEKIEVYVNREVDPYNLELNLYDILVVEYYSNRL